MKSKAFIIAFTILSGISLAEAEEKKPAIKPEERIKKLEERLNAADAQKKIEVYPKDISIPISVPKDPKKVQIPGTQEEFFFGFKIKTPEEEMKIRQYEKDKFNTGILNGILIERNYIKCLDTRFEIMPAFCFGSISVSSHIFIDAFGPKQNNKDFNIKDPIYFDANFANIDLLWDNRSVGITAAVATSTINLQKAVIAKVGFIVQSENLRAEFGWLRVGFDSEGNNGLYFGIGVPLISYASALKEKIVGK